jgi:leucine-rich repeat protein SHOC2
MEKFWAKPSKNDSIYFRRLYDRIRGDAIIRDQWESYKLVGLIIKDAQLTAIPEEIFHFKNLEFLDLSHNHLHNLDCDLSQCYSLYYLNLSHNAITDLDCFREECLFLTEMDLSDNPLEYIGPTVWQNLTKLRELDLSRNRLQNDALFDLHHIRRLREIYLDGSHQLDINGLFSYLPVPLEQLHINNTGLTELSTDIGLLKKLNYLDISQNQFSDLPSTMKYLNALEILDMYSNAFSHIPPVLLNLPELVHVNLYQNPVSPLIRHLAQISGCWYDPNGKTEGFPDFTNFKQFLTL